MAFDINLLPDVVRRKKERKYLFSTLYKVGVAILILGEIFFGTSYYFYSSKKVEFEENNRALEEKKSQLLALKAQKKKGDDLNFRLVSIMDILEKRRNYSIFFSKIKPLIPQGVSVFQYSIDENNSIILSGLSDNYAVLADFLSAIVVDSKNKGSLFKDVALSEVSLKKDSGKISYSMEVTINDMVLKDEHD